MSRKDFAKCRARLRPKVTSNAHHTQI